MPRQKAKTKTIFGLFCSGLYMWQENQYISIKSNTSSLLAKLWQAIAPVNPIPELYKIKEGQKSSNELMLN